MVALGLLASAASMAGDGELLSPGDVATALVEWVRETLDEIDSAYDHATSEKDQPFPDVAVEITEIRELDVPDEGTHWFEQVQQANFQAFSCELIFVVDPDPPQDASDALYDFVDRLGTAARDDNTLGSRVDAIRRDFSFSLRPAFVEFDDGSRGRAMTMRLVVVTRTS